MAKNEEELKEYRRNYYKANKEKIDAQNLKNYYKNREYRIKKNSEYQKTHPDVRKRASRKYRETSWRKNSIGAAKNRAKKKGIPFDKNLCESDLSESMTCPCCNRTMKVESKQAENASPTVDKIIPELGYIKGNIIALCYRCNRLKSDATPEELEMIAKFMREQIKIVKEKLCLE